MKRRQLRAARDALKNNRGFTLVELMVVIALLSLVLAVIFQFFSFSGAMLTRTDELATQQSQGRMIVQGLRKDFGTAATIAIFDSSTPDTYTPPAGSYSIYAMDGQLYRKDSAGTATVIYTSFPANNLAVTFSSTSATIIHIAVTTTDASGAVRAIGDTDVFTQNTTVTAATGNLVVYLPSA